jgi:DNA-binding transcriptional LysR family regulator/DNA-binding Xre family transcriptional regulator
MLVGVPKPNWHAAGQDPTASATAESVRSRLRALRLTKGMSQAELARRSNMATSTLSRLESGERSLAVDHLAPLAAALEVSVAQLVGPGASAKPFDRPGSVPPDLDLRRLRYFVMLAEELHFGRAAERLHVSQPVLSRQIRQLELDLGVDLLTRTSRRVELTDAGRQVLDDARPLLATANATGPRARRADSGGAALTVGFLVGDPIIQLVQAFTHTHVEAEIDVARIYWSDQPMALLDDHVDVSFVHLPIDSDDLDLAHLYASPKVVLLPRRHTLAEQAEITIQELADEPVVRYAGASADWEAWHNVDPRPDGRRPRSGPTVRNLEETVEVVATGRAITLVPVTVTTGIQVPPEVVAVPVVDAPPTEVCLAWRTGRRSPLIRELVETARTTLSAVSS